MAVSRVVSKRIPICPGRDSRYTIRHNPDQPGNPWWVYYEPPGGDPIPADDPHAVLVELVNELKQQIVGGAGGSFSLTEYRQVIARMASPGGPGNAVHCIGVHAGTVQSYPEPLIFDGGALDPGVLPAVGAAWPGPLCGTTYSFAAPGNAMPPSHCQDEVFTEVAGRRLLLSTEAGVAPYPPPVGMLHDFLVVLRGLLPAGGRFRVNEHGRAFTANNHTFIGTVPFPHWFRPLTSTS